MTQQTYAQAISSAIAEAMERDQRIIVINTSFAGLTAPRPGITAPRSHFGILAKRFPDRVIKPPVSELGFCGMAVGAAMTGLRPIVAVGTGVFAYEAWPQIVNEAAVACYGSAGRITVPAVFYMASGIRGGGAVQHSHALQAMFANAPGLQVVMPATPSDARGLMLTAALESLNPTVFLVHQRLQMTSETIDAAAGPIPFGVADVKRPGKHVTVVALGVMVPRALEAAATLANENIDVEVLDPRTVVPLDKAAILASVAKTGRLVVADESQLTCGVASEIAAMVAEEGFASLKKPVRRIAIPNVPGPAHQDEEDFVTPDARKIVAAARALCVE
jgi:pyruvate dehydrogenase E1 component beta subunit